MHQDKKVRDKRHSISAVTSVNITKQWPCLLTTESDQYYNNAISISYLADVRQR
mgnify:CR=1 FL=1